MIVKTYENQEVGLHGAYLENDSEDVYMYVANSAGEKTWIWYGKHYNDDRTKNQGYVEYLAEFMKMMDLQKFI